MAEKYTFIEIKPLSVNECWQGKRFKTPKYKAYETEMFLRLPNKIKVTNKLEIIAGLHKLADLDNILKPFLDILQKKYVFNDKDITEMYLKKEIGTFIKFRFYD